MEQIKYNMRYILDQLALGGLEVRLFYSLQKKEVYCKIRVPLIRLMKEADRVNYILPLDPTETKKICTTGRKNLWAPLKIPELSDQTSYAPYDYLYAKFEYDTVTCGIRPDLSTVYKAWTLPIYRTQGPSPSASISIDLGSTVQSPLAIIELTSRGGGGVGGAVPSPSPLLPGDPDFVYSIFRGVDRLKLIYSIISCRSNGGCHLDIAQLVQYACILSFMPLHDTVELRQVEEQWLCIFQAPWKLHLDGMKNYFGEKIGLYFAFLGFYTAALIPAAVLGLLTWVWIAVDGNDPNAPSIPYFCGFMALWSALLLEFWKRNEKVTAMKWGMVDADETEQNRPQFDGIPSFSPVTGKPYVFFSRYERLKRALFSSAAILGFTLVVIGVIAAIFAIRVAMTVANVIIGSQPIADVTSSILIAIQVAVMNAIFDKLAVRLNNHENHRTDTEYEDSLIAKTFLFQFVNSYSSLFYIAFIKPFSQFDPCSYGGSCMMELQVTLGTIFLSQITVGNFTEVTVPLMSLLWKTWSREHATPDPDPDSNSNSTVSKNKRASAHVRSSEIYSDQMLLTQYANAYSKNTHKTQVSEIEKTFLMPEYNMLRGTLDDYAETVTQFGFTTMFVSAFPLATLLSLINNYVELRIDAWKLCQVMRRPQPRSCEDIGTWLAILEFVSIAAIFINSGIVAFTSTNASVFSWTVRVWIFILMASGLLCLKMLIAYVIPDTPIEVEIQLKRQEFIVGKLLDNIEDEDDVDVNNVGLIPEFSVNNTDYDPL